MNNEQAAEKMIELANEIRPSHPKQGEIIGILGCMTTTFEEGAIVPLWNMTQLLGEAAHDILKKEMSELENESEEE